MNELAWQHRRKYANAWLFFTALFSLMLISYAVIFATALSAYRQENQLLLEQITFYTQHIIQDEHDNFDGVSTLDMRGRDYVVVIFSPLEQIIAYSNHPQQNLMTATNWQVYKQKSDTTVETVQKLEAVRVLPDGYRIYVYLSLPNFYYRLFSPLNLLPLLLFFVILGLYMFYGNRQTRAWQSLLDYCQALPQYIVSTYQPYPVLQGAVDLDIAQMGQVINRFGFQLHDYFHQLNALTQQQQHLIENMPISLFMLNRKGRITYFNQQFSKEFMTPFYADAVYLLSDFVAGKDKSGQQILLNLSTIYTTVTVTVTDLQHHHFFDLHLQPVYNHVGKIESFSGCLQNVSDYQNALQEAWLTEKQQQDKIASFDSLWAVLGHELRTPLAGMLGMIEILNEEKSDFDSEQQEVIQTLQQSGQGMLQMLNDMLDIAKLGAGKLHTNIAQLDLFSLMRQVTELMVGNARRQHIDLLYHIDGQIPRYIETDDGRLRQILLNLMGNAIKFTRQGYVALLADLRDHTDPIIVENNTAQNPAQKWLRIMVKDTGIGISETEQKKLFSFFNQANESISRQFGGTGLGLAISNSFSQLLGGFIHLHSVVGEGSEFQVYLPLKNYVPQVSFNFKPSQYAFHFILILKYPISHEYVQKLFSSLELNFDVYVGLTPDVVARLNQTFNTRDPNTHTPLFVVDEHCYEEQPALFEQITCFDTSPKIFLTMNTERGLPTAILETFDGVLTKPITMNNFLAETTRVYDKFLQKTTPTYRPLSAQASYEQFLIKLAQTETAVTSPASDPALKTILVAEDNPVNQKIAQRHLTKLGYEVLLAEDGKRAIDLFHTHKSEIGLILMDCQMPVMDGLEATRIIRADQNSVPIIALTANHSEQDKQHCLAVGMDNFLTKPLNKDELVRLLNRYMI